MSLFNKKNQDFLGVDIGTSGIKIVQLTKEKDKAKLVTYGMVDVDADIIRNKTPESIKLIAQALEKIIDKARVSTKNCSTALPTFSVFSSVISLPQMTKSDLNSAVKWEAKKFIPFPIENMILDWKIINASKGSQKNQLLDNLNNKVDLGKFFNKDKTEGDQKEEIERKPAKTENDLIKTSSKFNKILLTAAPKSLVSVYVDIFKELELNLTSLEVESFAMTRALIADEKKYAMIVDIGSVTTDVCVVENGLPILNRSIEVGGNMMTESIAQSLNISFDRAEQFKQDFGLTMSKEEVNNVPKTIEETLSPMVNEIKYVFDLYRRQGSGKIDNVILSGGSAYLPSLVDYLSKVLNTTVYIGDAWYKVMYPKELKPVLDEVGPRFSVAVGLALRGII
jgi:type IV pilus assembly protein PilM